jgi:gamma-glutamylputrescine oxidase
VTTSHWFRPHLFRVPDVATDVAVVGGGYAGLATAYWLTETRPDLRVTVVDRAACGAGASGRNAGFLTMGSAAFYNGLARRWGAPRARAVLGFAAESLELVNQHILKASPEVKFERTASQTLFQTESQLAGWRDPAFAPDEFNFRWRDGGALPEALRGRFAGAYEACPEYKVNPVQLLGSLKKLLESRRVQIVEGSSAFRLTPEGVATEVNAVRARQVVLALNGYLPQFHPAFAGVVTPRRAQMLAVELESEFDGPGLYYDPLERVYWRKTQEKVLVIGGKRLVDEAGETGDFEKISPAVQDALEHYLRDRLGFRYTVLNRWSGVMGFTEHELPFVDRLAAPVPTVVVGGFSGHGMGLGFNAGREAAALVTGAATGSFFTQFKRAEICL